MSDKIARLGIERNNDLMYYIKGGDVWAVPRKQKGQPKGRAARVASIGLEMDNSRYIYFLDKDGDVSRTERALGRDGKHTRSSKGMRVRGSMSGKKAHAKVSTPIAQYVREGRQKVKDLATLGARARRLGDERLMALTTRAARGDAGAWIELRPELAMIEAARTGVPISSKGVPKRSKGR